jgi:hypothetical protein
MAICRYCGEKAGRFSEAHGSCRQKAGQGIEALKQCVADAIVQGRRGKRRAVASGLEVTTHMEPMSSCIFDVICAFWL